MEIIHLKREIRFAFFRSLPIYLDGKKIGMIKENQTLEIPVLPGNHEIFVKMDWSRSNKIVFNIAEGEQTHFKCTRSIQGWQLGFLIFYMLFFWNRIIQINQLDKNGNPIAFASKFTLLEKFFILCFILLVLLFFIKFS